MDEFWEEAFSNRHMMWGEQPATSAIETREQFKKLGFRKILIPGFGYGRNAKPFLDGGFEVTGIEISKTAIQLAHQLLGDKIKVFHGSVEDMPIDQDIYEGIFCHALIHLLGSAERRQLLANCHAQLKSGGLMVFTAITKDASTYGMGEKLGRDRFRTRDGVACSSTTRNRSGRNLGNSDWWRQPSWRNNRQRSFGKLCVEKLAVFGSESVYSMLSYIKTFKPGEQITMETIQPVEKKGNSKVLIMAGVLALSCACSSLSTPSTSVPIPPTDTAVTSTLSLPSSTTDCHITVASYDTPHAANDIGGQALYDLAATEPSDVYLSASAIVMEAQHLVSESDDVDGTLVLAYIGDLDGDVIKAHVLLIYLPDGGEAVNQLPVDSKIGISGPYVGYVYPPKNLFAKFPNEKEDTKFPSIKAETASYGCP
jgi:SAM-dependent methyltransferase